MGRVGSFGAGYGEPLTANCFSIYDEVSKGHRREILETEEEKRTSSRLSASSALKLAGAATDMVGDLERGQMICATVYGR